MSRIVKSVSVVDDRPHSVDEARERAGAGLMGKTIIKGGAMNAYGISSGGVARQFMRDDYLNEINHLRIEAEEVKAEIRKLRTEIEGAKAELETAKAEAEAELKKREEYGEDILDDEIFHSRMAELENATASAKEQAEAIVEAAHRQADEVLEKARMEGYEDGLNKGQDEASAAFNAEAEPKLMELSEMITAVSNYGPELMREKEREFVDLAAAIAGKVVGRELKANPQYIVDMLRESAQKNQRESYITITLSPDMLPTELTAAQEITALIEGMANNISVYVDKNAAEQTCTMETPNGVIDMSVGTQLDNISGALIANQL